MKSIVVVLLFAAAAQAGMPTFMRKIIRHHGRQRALYEEYTNEHIELSVEDHENTFHGLDVSASAENVINEDDLKKFYWHKDHAYAFTRFFQSTEKDGNKQVTKTELNEVFKKKPIKVALKECHYLKSTGLKQSCFADQLVTYYSLALNNGEVQTFYDNIADKQTKKITLEWVKKNKDFDCGKTAAEELGAYSDGVVSLEEFEDYVKQESINDDFRKCRTSANAETGAFTWNNECLEEELENYINDDLTEMDISVLFRAFDKDDSKHITKKELEQLPGVTKEVADNIMKLLDMSITKKQGGEAVVDYGEFRTYLRSPTVLYQAEKRCTEEVSGQMQEMDCMYDLLIELFKHDHDSIWLVMPDIEQQTMFEILDKDNNGEIKKDELDWSDDVEARFFEEFDKDDDDEDEVTLEEFNEYVDIPHMVYGTADCLLHKGNEVTQRETCYPDEIKDIMTNIKHTDDHFLHMWFDHYDTDGDDFIHEVDNNEAAALFGTKQLEKLFLQEVGQGNEIICPFEFLWYTKQQGLAKKYAGKGTTPQDIPHYHAVMKEYIEKEMTEYDIQELFDVLDSNDNHELDAHDFGAQWNVVKNLVKHIDGLGNDKDETVNFREFWLWIQSGTVKSKFEACTAQHDTQAAEIKCYETLFKTKPETLV